MFLLGEPKEIPSSFKSLSKTFYSVIILLLPLVISCKKAKISEPPIQSSGPNIILFLADDYGYEIPGCDTGQSYQTPNIDMMAANGMRFTQCYSSPLCSPSRIMLLTGKYNFRNYDVRGRLDPDQKTFANMLRSSGFNTCIAGKWQIAADGNGIKNFGFDNYCLWNVIGEDDYLGSRYKSPHLYQDNQYIPDNVTKNKYSEDIFTDYIINFIKQSKNIKRPFFVYYPFCLTHVPFSPTPDDPEYQSWNTDASDAKFFPSMVKYMDKKIGQIIQEIKDDSLENNTVFLFTADNGTPKGIFSLQNGQYVEGGKGLTTQAGTHVPLVVYWPAKITPSVNNNLVDFTDFLPTFADIAGIPEPNNYGILDGKSFYPQLINMSSNTRDWVFCHFALHQFDKPIRYVWNQNDKYYEDGRFYDLTDDIFELHPMPDNKLTEEQKNTKEIFKKVLAEMHN